MDDEKDIHIIFDYMLKGFDLLHAYDGNHALDIIKENKLNDFLLLTDINMPNMDGLELIKSVRKINNKCQCLVMSAYDENRYSHEILKLDISKYFSKPINMEYIKKYIRSQ